MIDQLQATSRGPHGRPRGWAFAADGERRRWERCRRDGVKLTQLQPWPKDFDRGLAATVHAIRSSKDA